VQQSLADGAGCASDIFNNDGLPKRGTMGSVRNSCNSSPASLAGNGTAHCTLIPSRPAPKN